MKKLIFPVLWKRLSGQYKRTQERISILLQFSYACEYYQERLKMFINDNVFENDDLLREQLMKFIKGALYLQ